MRATGTNTAEQNANEYIHFESAWGTGPATIDLGASQSARVSLTGVIYDGGAGTLVIRAGDNANVAMNGVEQSFTVPAGANANAPFHLFAELEPVGRFITLDPGTANFTGVATLWVYPV
jgi:hypothetical protein